MDPAASAAASEAASAASSAASKAAWGGRKSGWKMIETNQSKFNKLLVVNC